MLPLIVGTLLAVGALCFVLLPLWQGTVAPRRRVLARDAVARDAEEEAVAALREIEFDRETGKLSDADYGELRVRYTEEALAAMRAGALPPDADPAEAIVRAARARLKSCAHCGPRPEPDANYCSRCGLFLPGACADCGAAVTEPSAGFCASCGRQLAA